MARPEVPTLSELIQNPRSAQRKLDKLTDAQLHSFVQSVKDSLRGFGLSRNLPANPADFALRFSRGSWRVADHLLYLSRQLLALEQRKITRLLVSMPVRHGKSFLTDIYFPAWWLARHPKDRVILVGYGESFARDWGSKVRDLILEFSDDLNLLVDKDRTAADDWQLTSGGGMICVGAGGSLMGRGADLLILDDVVKSSEEAESETYRNKTWEWFQSTAMTRLQPNAVVVGVMTRWHQDDLFGRIIANDTSSSWTVLNIPALAEANDPLGRPLDAPLWPSFWPDPDHYQKVRASTSDYWWSSLYQGHPTPMGGGIIKEAWFQFHNPSSLPTEFDQLIQSWDLSLKDKETSDWNVGQLWGRKGASLYLLDQVRGHYTLDQVSNLMRQFTLKHPKATAKLVEDAAMGPLLKQTLHHEVGGIIPITPKGSKWARVQAVIPLLQAGNVYLPERPDGTKDRWVWDLISEAGAFPKGTHDDQVDALTQAISFLSPGLWQNQARTTRAAAFEALPIRTPAELRDQWFRKFYKEAMQKADRKFAPRHSLLSRLRKPPL